MTLGTPGKPVEITKDNALTKIIEAATIPVEAATPPPHWRVFKINRFMDHRQCRRLRREMRLKRGRRVSFFQTEKVTIQH